MTQSYYAIALNPFSAVRYLLNMADELGVTVNHDSGLDESRLVVVARKMVKPKIAVYYGNGTTGGAIWFIRALEAMGFDMGIVTAEDIMDMVNSCYPLHIPKVMAVNTHTDY